MTKLIIRPTDNGPCLYQGQITQSTLIPAIYSTFVLVGVSYDVVNVIYIHQGDPAVLTAIEIIVRETFNVI